MRKDKWHRIDSYHVKDKKELVELLDLLIPDFFNASETEDYSEYLEKEA
ncbi:MAG: hypothetical protein ACNS62_23260 [Candidatus Cyclobacteriaceae bacterium M3_2C_046]